MEGFVRRNLDATGPLALRNSPGEVRREATGMPLNTNPHKAKIKTVREPGGLDNATPVPNLEDEKHDECRCSPRRRDGNLVGG
jgi:hypothetical protein